MIRRITFTLTFLAIVVALYATNYARKDAADDRALAQRQQNLARLLTLKETSGSAAQWLLVERDYIKEHAGQDADQDKVVRIVTGTSDRYYPLSEALDINRDLFEMSRIKYLLEADSRIAKAQDELKMIIEGERYEELKEHGFDLYFIQEEFIFRFDAEVINEIRETQEDISMLSGEL